MNISIITFTENGTKLAEKIRQAFEGTKTEESDNAGNHDITKYGTVTIENRCKKNNEPLENNKAQTNNRGLSLSDWTRQQFAEKNAIVVIGACGIAVRMIAPFVSDKLSDSPVVVADEAAMSLIK